MDPIQHLLRQADAADALPSESAASLVHRVKHRLRRKRRRKIALSAVTTVIIAATASAWLVTARPFDANQRGDDQSALLPTQPPITGVQDDTLADLRRQAEFHMRIVDRLIALETKRKSRRAKKKLPPDPLEEIRWQVEQAALVIVHQADRKYNELNLPDSAVADYRRVIKVFPNTHWADVARQRLADINT